MYSTHKNEPVIDQASLVEYKGSHTHYLSFYPQLNGLRFLFILFVLLHHWGPENIFKAIRLGWLGVDLFYVLSGFLIGEILLRQKEKSTGKFHSIKNFIVRRALRIFPLYYLTIIIYSLAVTTGGILWWNLTYTNNILQFINFNRVPEVFWHLWSLCVEEQFYLFFPFLVFFVGRKIFLYVVIGGIFMAVAGRFILMANHVDYMMDALMPFCLDSLFTGVLLAYIKTYHLSWLQKKLSNTGLVVAIIVLLTATLLILSLEAPALYVHSLYRFFGSLLGFLAIGYSVIIGYSGGLKKIFELGFLSSLGKISYGIYLLHPFVEYFYRQYFNNNFVKDFFVRLPVPGISNAYLVDFLILFLITIGIAYCSFELIEKRFLKLKSLFSQ